MIPRSVRFKVVVIYMAVAAAAVTAASCDDNSTNPEPYNPDLPSAWVRTVTNSFFKLTPGTIAEFENQTNEGLETIRVEVLPDTTVVNGVTATVVRDRVSLDGELVEDTYDWYAQDVKGNVWYLGEDTKEYENGQVVSTEGSWKWGVDGALPGIIMWSNPADHVGEEYRQEFYAGEAEDWGKVVALDQNVTVPYGDFTGCVQIEEWNDLEPSAAHENKYYAPGIGVVLETGGGEHVELVRLTLP